MLKVQITAKLGRGQELAQLIQPVPIDNEIDGCSGIDVYVNTSSPDIIVIIEYWDSIQRHKTFLSNLQAAGGLDKMLELSEAVNRTYFFETTQ
jgi:quinol monooxygenase YgiN